MDNIIGRRLDGRYQIEEAVGEGGMADVYRATDLRDNRTVAVKILRDEYRDNEDLVRRFKNESRAISVLNHENIVKVFDVSVTDKIQYIVMEYIDGITLKDYIEQRGEPLTYKETLHFIKQILQALQHAHDKGIVHRDIKPQNIMLLQNGNLKVMDFGIARLARSESHARPEHAIGSVHYISPEQAKGDLTDPRADIYSVGIMMYEMLSGRLPFESGDAVSIAIAQISDDPTPIRDVNPAVPQGLCEITMKAMAKDPRFRYQNALEMMRDIDDFKRDPSVKFDYDYISDNAPSRYIDKVVNDSKRTGQPANGASGARKGKQPMRRIKRKKKHSWLVPITATVTLVVVGACLLLTYNLFQNSGNPLFTQYENIELPDFVGMHYEDVLAMAKSPPYNHLRFEKPSYEHNPGVEADVVISQNPTSSNENKKMVKANQRIYLTVSQGIQDVQLPNLTGMTRSEAIKAVLELGLRPYVRYQVEEGGVKGRVLSTDPAAGSVVQNLPDTVVTIFLCSERGNWDRTVPSVVGMELEAAKNTLRGAGLTPGPTKEDYSDLPAGTVMAQTPEGGTVSSVATTVFLTISLGPPPPPAPVETALPSVIGASQDAAVSSLSAGGFSVVTNSAYSPDVAAGLVMGQSPGAGNYPVGTAVTLTISLGPDPNASSSVPSSSEMPSSSDAPPSSEVPPSSEQPAPPEGNNGNHNGENNGGG